MSDSTPWELVIGLEVHAELATVTKLFSGSPNRFGDEPNTNIDPVTLGLPGALPVLNRQAVELAMRIGLALNCRIQPCVFHRKNYFYPDMPKAYQISQYDVPLNVDGWLDLPDGTRIGVERAHLEEDTGKSTHTGGTGGRIHGSDSSLIDFNRAGVPLVEIVGRPDLRTSEQARQYVTELRAILVAVGASDAKMEEGSMRVDANVSVRRPGEPLGTRCEVKNLNSMRSLGRAIDYEVRRQTDLIEAGDVVRQETRHWDETDGRTHTLRTKEDADDYRYFPEPDLVPLDPDESWVRAVRDALPPLPGTRRAELAALTGAAADAESVMVVVDRGQEQYVHDAVAAGGDSARALIHVKEAYADQGPTPAVPAAALAALTRLELDRRVTATQAKQILARLVADGDGDPAAVAASMGFEALDAEALERLVDEAIAANAGAWAKYSAGEDKAAGALVGAVMKASKGRADGQAVTALLRARRR
ncbi:MAG: Asp-tRNA(Asn)/Glu-tRNA(Gln) amidotransferase subunit GatB [Acidimicrobiia bacterium]|nr:Asp-tRNA(Asn)/Glu-tRNA(Gln) amidotransferase subunit GatB [Acidimicrobiia bacterium]